MTLTRVRRAARAGAPIRVGTVAHVVGLELGVRGLRAAIGDAVTIDTPRGPLAAEVVAVRGDELLCAPLGELDGVAAGAPVVAAGRPWGVTVGRGVIGRVLDGLGRPIDGLGPIASAAEVPVSADPPHPLSRQPLDRQLSLGVRALDAMTPCAVGQRIGIFAGSGVGKSSLLSMIARGTSADVAVLALIGERGREVREFIERDLGEEGLRRSVVVVATSDEPALVRKRAAFTATRIAESFRDEGADVVLMMDSLTRFAMAQREIGLAAGEPPATRGYPPSVFSLLPKLLERAGAAATGSITGLYTVLVEGDDMNEPIGDAARSILDGHVVLSRRLGSAGHFPSIDVLESVSRLFGAITTPEQRADVVELRRLLAAHAEAKDLIEIGAYVQGTNHDVDRAVALRPAIDAFLRQDVDATSTAADAWSHLHQLLRGAA